MVNNVTSLTGNGLKDWLIQRVTAVFFAVYVFFLLGFFILHPELSFKLWHRLFANPAMQIASAMALLSLTLHAWIGIWTVTTDYFKCTVLRLSIQMLVLFWLVSQLIWGLLILWGR